MLGALVLVLGAGTVIAAARSTRSAKPGGDDLPFRLGKVQTGDLQVRVREVGAVDPVDKVDVKSAVSGRVTSIRVDSSLGF
jgi:multidrug efflux pump subunit AcrA (membrane-fusion protein)